MTNNNYDKFGERRKTIPFENKVKRVKDATKNRYQIIVDGLRKYNFNDRISVHGETFSFKKRKLIYLTFIGETLKVYFRLKYKDYIDSTIPLKDASTIKKYKDTPTYLVIKSDLAARRVVLLGEKIVKQNRIPKHKS